MLKNWSHSFMRLLGVVVLGLIAVPASADPLAEYYIGIDNRTAPFSGYPDNPNFGRLTLLYAHGNHYHGIGTYAYSGLPESPVLQDTSGNNRLPEISSGQPGIPLVPGSGVYAGKRTTAAQPGVPFSDLEMRNVHSLVGVDDVLFNSSSNRWNADFAGADVHLKLVSVSDPALHVGTLTDPFALSVGGDLHVGEGDEHFSFMPVLWVDSSAPIGNYWAEFQLVDGSGTYGDSGRFFMDVSVVPEPSALILGGMGLVGLACWARRRTK